MRTYTVTIQWLNRYTIKTKTIRGIKANNIIEAGEKALAPYKNRVCVSISCIWYDWPQKS